VGGKGGLIKREKEISFKKPPLTLYFITHKSYNNLGLVLFSKNKRGLITVLFKPLQTLHQLHPSRETPFC